MNCSRFAMPLFDGQRATGPADAGSRLKLKKRSSSVAYCVRDRFDQVAAGNALEPMDLREGLWSMTPDLLQYPRKSVIPGDNDVSIVDVGGELVIPRISCCFPEGDKQLPLVDGLSHPVPA